MTTARHSNAPSKILGGERFPKGWQGSLKGFLNACDLGKSLDVALQILNKH